jgi:hypothetical protein
MEEEYSSLAKLFENAQIIRKKSQKEEKEL